ncbi:MAG: type II toxin-antitoxin system HipA family toxin [Desulfobulbaceae bacterium]|uniref:Type II toxin-antitoxin system HipA family toxin n=1 Tax=Candidatus Desulfobia pelagia TaxID=2841692 RepID=A0A8J6TFC5_9BACT|nr:type II toxin-antitoxin system HipA family toxin [Candidatus Desulfobia pelagia]
MAKDLREIDVHFTTTPDESFQVGTLVQQGHRLFFEYNSQWINRGLELSPFTLPLRPGLYEHTNREFGPLFGLFDDSLPDGWGLLLMDRYFRKIGFDPVTISPLERLVYLGEQTMGALTYHPPRDRSIAEPTLFDLHKLAKHSQEIFAGDPTDVLPQLLRAGGGPGGARPKVLIGYNPATSEIISGEDNLPDGFEHWIVKFSAREEARDAGPVEYAYSLMAREAGIEMPETHLFKTDQGDCFFATKRFDRETGNHRHHIHTFGNLIEADFRLPNCDYADLLKVTGILTKNHEEVIRVFRLMVFNVLAHNRDDHVKNFSFILDDASGGWMLAPAYDLVFTSGPGGEHTTTIAGEGRNPLKRHLFQLADQFDINQRLANKIFDEVSLAISKWRMCAISTGVTPRTCDQIARQINP